MEPRREVGDRAQIPISSANGHAPISTRDHLVVFGGAGAEEGGGRGGGDVPRNPRIHGATGFAGFLLGFYWVLPSFTGFDLVLLGLTGFDWV